MNRSTAWRLLARIFFVCGATAVSLAAQSSSSTTSSGGSSGAPPLGQTPGSPASGSQVFFESQALAYGSMDQITDLISQDVCDGRLAGSNIHFVLFDTYSFQAIQQFRAFQRGVGVLSDMLQSYPGFPPSVPADLEVIRRNIGALSSHAATLSSTATAGGPSLQVAEGVFQTLSSVIGASTVDKNATFPISDVAIAMSLSRHLAGRCSPFDVTYPRIALSEDPEVADKAEAKLHQAMQKLFSIQRQAATVAQNAEDLEKAKDAAASTGGGAGSGVQAAVVGMPFATQLQAQIKDAAGNPLAGIPVTFSAPTSGPSGTFAAVAGPPVQAAGPTTQVTTDMNGLAKAPIFTANATVGNYTVIARAQTLNALQTSFTLSNIPSVPAAISVPGGAAVSGSASGAATLPGVLPRSVTGSDYLSLTATTGLLDQFMATYLQPQASTGLSPLGNVLAGAQLLRALTREGKTYILFWEGSAAGGTQRDRKNLITALITGDWISYSGGAVVSFGVIDASTGQLMKPSMHTIVTPYTHFSYRPGSHETTNKVREGIYGPEHP